MVPPCAPNGRLATKYNYTTWKLESPIFPLVRATGFNVKDWQNLILVNQVGKRFFDETKGDVPHGNNGAQITPYTPNDYRNAEKLEYNPTKYNFTHAALAMNEYSTAPDYCPGPIWAIFDAAAVQREGWKVVPPYVDPDGYFFSADTLEELAAGIENEYQAKPMKGHNLARDGGALQLNGRSRRRSRFRKAVAKIQDSNAAVLCRLGNCGGCTIRVRD
jgi:hypothetical protein